MSLLELTAPPLPHFIACGEDTYPVGGTHASRKNILVFDLLVVTRGMLHMAEESQQWAVGPGQTLVLRPDLYHYCTKPCDEETHFYWMHFQTVGEWSVADERTIIYLQNRDLFGLIHKFNIYLPKHGTIIDPQDTYEKIRRLLQITQLPESQQWREQVLFQEILLSLQEDRAQHFDNAVQKVTHAAATYLQQHYKQPVDYDVLGKDINFHPTYISRSMKKILGITPHEYLTRYRIDKAKQLLKNTNMPITQVAEEVGFDSISHFSRTFSSLENMPPRIYRQGYRM